MQSNKIIIYQIFTRLFGNTNYVCKPNGTLEENGCGKFNQITPRALEAIREMGITHIWYTGIIAHASQTDYSAYGIPRNHPSIVKGKAGSPYAIRDYYDVDPDLAEDMARRMEEFEALIDRTHSKGMKVIIDFVPNHVARQYHSIAKPQGIRDLGEDDDTTVQFTPDNNFYYLPDEELKGEINLEAPLEGPYKERPAKATGNNKFDAYPNIDDWYETVKLNYGTDYFHHTGNHFSPLPDTWKKMRDILLFWAAKGIDGFRCDMAEMVPCEFWGWVIPQVKADYPHLLFIAEVYNPHEYRHYIHNGHFDYLYDKVGLYDSLRAIVSQHASATQITWRWQEVSDIQSHMLNFLENHDEQRIASDFFAGNPQKAIPALLISALTNTNPMMIYFGQELGEMGMDEEGFSGRDGRTTIFDYWSIDSIRRWNHDGKFDETFLTLHERELRHAYCRILSLANEESAFREGAFFDLMYVNCNGWQMDEHRQYAFLRKAGNEVILVAVNFSELPAHVQINLPQHAFDFLEIPPMEEVVAHELLTLSDEPLSFTPEKPTSLTLPAHGGKLLKITF